MHLRLVPVLLALLWLSQGAPAAQTACRHVDFLANPDNWKRLEFKGIAPNRFSVQDAGIRIASKASASMLYLDLTGLGFHSVSWTWRSQGAMPASKLDETGPDDRRLSVSVGFDHEDNTRSFFERSMRSLLETVYGASLPGRVIAYTWSSGGHRVGEAFDNPYTGADAKTIILRNGPDDEAPNAVTVMPADDYRRLYGEAAPTMTYLGIFADTDGTDSEIASEIRDLCLN